MKICRTIGVPRSMINIPVISVAQDVLKTPNFHCLSSVNCVYVSHEVRKEVLDAMALLLYT